MIAWSDKAFEDLSNASINLPSNSQWRELIEAEVKAAKKGQTAKKPHKQKLVSLWNKVLDVIREAYHAEKLTATEAIPSSLCPVHLKDWVGMLSRIFAIGDMEGAGGWCWIMAVQFEITMSH